MKLTKREVLRLRAALRAGENYADLCAVDEDYRAKRALRQITATIGWLDKKVTACEAPPMCHNVRGRGTKT